MGKIAAMGKAVVAKVKGAFRNDEPPTPPTGAVPVSASGYSPVPEPKFRNPDAAKPMNRMVHVSQQLEAVPPGLQSLFGLPPFVVSGQPGNTLVLGRNAAKRRAARISKLLGDDNLTRKRLRRCLLEGLSA